MSQMIVKRVSKGHYHALLENGGRVNIRKQTAGFYAGFWVARADWDKDLPLKVCSTLRHAKKCASAMLNGEPT